MHLYLVKVSTSLTWPKMGKDEDWKRVVPFSPHRNPRVCIIVHPFTSSIGCLISNATEPLPKTAMTQTECSKRRRVSSIFWQLWPDRKPSVVRNKELWCWKLQDMAGTPSKWRIDPSIWRRSCGSTTWKVDVRRTQRAWWWSTRINGIGSELKGHHVHS